MTFDNLDKASASTANAGDAGPSAADETARPLLSSAPRWAITIGLGLRTPQGRRRAIDAASPVEDLAEVLAGLNRVDGDPDAIVDRQLDEAWFAPDFQGSRHGGRVLAACFVAVDIDTKPKAEPPRPVRDALYAALQAVSGVSIVHETPHGGRAIFVLNQPTTNAKPAAQGAVHRVRTALLKEGLLRPDGPLEIDVGASCDPKRKWLGPRGGRIVRVSRVPNDWESLAADAPLPKAAAEARTADESGSFAEAVRKWNQSNPSTYPPPNKRGCCPICGSSDGFSQLGDNSDRWACRGAKHNASGVGVKCDVGFHGDALDIEAFTRRMTREEVLVADGFLNRRGSTSAATPRPSDLPTEAEVLALSAVDWGEPIPFTSSSPAPLPVDSLPPVVADFVNDVATKVQVPSDLVVNTAVGVLSSAMKIRRI